MMWTFLPSCSSPMRLFCIGVFLGAAELLPPAMADTFLYFGYGSNLLASRIHVNNPTAARNTSAKLKDYRLDFNNWSHKWNGSIATIVPDKDAEVWGAVWEIDNCNMVNLDRQEGIPEKMYFPFGVDVMTADGKILQCRTYQLHDNPKSEDDVLPMERRPSKTYLNVIISGAEESELPHDYVDKLRKIPHNGRTGFIPSTERDYTSTPHP